MISGKCNKYAVCCQVIVILFSLFAFSISNAYISPAKPDVKSKSALLVDFHSGSVLFEKNSEQLMEPASLTKIMTSYIAFEYLQEGKVNLDDLVLISENAYKQKGSRTFLEINSKVRFEDVLMGMIVQSGNDASVAIAEHIAGSVENFVLLMNLKAEQMGLKSTVYTNPTGLDAEVASEKQTVTNSIDLSILVTKLIKDFPEYYQWYKVKEYTYNNIRQSNRNELLFQDDTVDGVKTGRTNDAGYCLVASSSRDGMRLISIVLNASSQKERVLQSQRLLNYGFRYFQTKQIYSAGQEVKQLKVWQGDANSVAIGIDRDTFLTLPKNVFNRLNIRISSKTELIAPVQKGESFGKVDFIMDDEIVTSYSLVALESVAEANVFVRIWHQFLLAIRPFFQIFGFFSE